MGASADRAGGSRRAELAESASSLCPRVRVRDPRGSTSWHGVVCLRGGPGQWEFPGALLKGVPPNPRSRAGERKAPVAGRAGQGLCFGSAAGHCQAWGDGWSASSTAKRPFGPESEPRVPAPPRSNLEASQAAL